MKKQSRDLDEDKIHVITMPNQPHVPSQGVWCPAVTLFDSETDSLDLPNQKLYFKYLSDTGLAGLVILGTNAGKNRLSLLDITPILTYLLY